MEKRKLIYAGLVLGAAGGATAYFMMNKKARVKASKMISKAANEMQDYMHDKMDY